VKHITGKYIMNIHPEISNTIILINRNGMGESDSEQGKFLIKKYLKVLNDSNYLPHAICLYTAGVKLATDGSHVLDELKLLVSKGVKLFVCGTCLINYDIFEQIRVGTICGMPDIVEAQWKAEKVITL
jgi:hypothetical protein